MCAYAQENMPSEPDFSYEKTKSKVATPVYKEDKQTSSDLPQSKPVITSRKTGNTTVLNLNSLANSVLVAAINRNDSEMNSNIMQMMQSGAEAVSSPQIIFKKSDSCPPVRIRVNGKKLSGDICAVLLYLYKGERYEAGYCE